MNDKATDPAVSNLEAAELKILLGPVYSYLAALQQPGANVQTAVAGLQSLELSELAQGPLFEAVGINNVASAIQSKIQAWEASVTASSGSGSSTSGKSA